MQKNIRIKIITPILCLASTNTIGMLTSCHKVTNCTITINQGEHGVTTQQPLTIASGTKWGSVKNKIINPTPNEGWEFYQWWIDGTKITDDYVITRNITITAIYTEQVCSITLLPGEHGTLTTKSLDVVYGRKWSDAKLSINDPKTTIGWIFKEWTLNGATIPDDYVIKSNISLVATYIQGKLINNSWAEIVSACEQHEAGELTEEEFIKKFTINGNQATQASDLIGAVTWLTINNQYHMVRIIDIDHDTMTSSEKAALTFELETLLSDSEGNPYHTVWDTTNNADYSNSTFRANLTGKGTVSKQTLPSTAFNMLPLELQPHIKEVKKVTSKCDTSSTPYTYSDLEYSDKLFPISYIELGKAIESGTPARTEGTAYSYWQTHTEDQYRIKRDANYIPYSYWLVSPATMDIINTQAWYVHSTSGMVYSSGNVRSTEQGQISFGFCI